jgi:hypothetical protein
VSAETVTRTIQLILAPVVMLSACAVFVGRLLSHYEAINARMRSMARERLDIVKTSVEEDYFVTERLSEIDLQLPLLLHRHGLSHHSLLAAYLCILVLVVSMCTIAISAIFTADWLVTLVIAMFVTGIAAMLVSVVFIALEVRTSRQAVSYEVRRVLHFGHMPVGVTQNDPDGTKAAWTA